MQLEQLEKLIIEKYEDISPESLPMGVRGSKPTIAFLQYAARREASGTGELPSTSFRAHSIPTDFALNF